MIKQTLRSAAILLAYSQLIGFNAYSTASNPVTPDACSKLLEFSDFQPPKASALLSYQDLASGITTRRLRVSEFHYIRDEAKKRGLRVWLFGGTASSFSHYVKWDLLREKGDPRFQPDRYDYEFTQIYRSTQDIDIVVDGSFDDAMDFEDALKIQFPYFHGTKKAAWEVRSLKESSSKKGGILDDFGFMNQHSDSNSTGMIELTDPPAGESVVRDVRDWNNHQDPTFLKDITDGKITYYYSSRHSETPLAQAGKNPPIFSVIRALIKVFQFGLKISDHDYVIFEKIIQQYNPRRDINNPYIEFWIDKNGKKLFQNAIDVEYAWNTLENLGLRKKLLYSESFTTHTDSLFWWMNKEPLRSYPLGTGNGKTAEELKIRVVAHETNSFIAYESITHSPMGTANVFISRKGQEGEEAAFGNGFYTAKGTEGAAGTGITIRFEVNPRARVGTDFIVTKHNYILFKNKNAIRVIPEYLEMSPVEYFMFLVRGEEGEDLLNESNQALFWKLKRKMSHLIHSGLIPQKDMDMIRLIVLKSLQTSQVGRKKIIQEWIKIEGSRLKKEPEVIQPLVESLKSGRFWDDPEPLFSAILEFSNGTLLESYIHKIWIPSRIEKIDLGSLSNQALEHFVLSKNTDFQTIGKNILAQREINHSTPFIQALKKIQKQGGDIQLWLRSPSQDQDENQSKLAYLVQHPELRNALSNAEIQRIAPTLISGSFRPIFEMIKDEDLPANIEEESFKFNPILFPQGGVEVVLGSPSTEPGFWNDESQYRVTLTKSFEIQRTPVTQLQWALIMETNPSHFYLNGIYYTVDQTFIAMNPNRPVESVSWNDVQQFIRRLNSLDPDYHYRLPSEAEWEYVARAGTSTAYFFGDDPKDLGDYAWYSHNSNNQTHDVAKLKPNPYGLYDLYGNVAQWVQDQWSPDRPSQVIDPHGPRFGSGRVSRGGGYLLGPKFHRSAYRSNADDTGFGTNLGFRLVRTPKSRFLTRTLENFKKTLFQEPSAILYRGQTILGIGKKIFLK